MHMFKCVRVKRWVTENGQQYTHPSRRPVLHPFLYPLTPALEFAGVCWSPSQLSWSEGELTTWTSRRFIAGPQRKTYIPVPSHTRTYGQFWVPNWPHTHVLGLYGL